MEQTGETAAVTFDQVLSQVDFSAISDNFIKVILAVIVPTIGIIALKKGYGWLKRFIKGM